MGFRNIALAVASLACAHGASGQACAQRSASPSSAIAYLREHAAAWPLAGAVAGEPVRVRSFPIPASIDLARVYVGSTLFALEYHALAGPTRMTYVAGDSGNPAMMGIVTGPIGQIGFLTEVAQVARDRQLEADSLPPYVTHWPDPRLLRTIVAPKAGAQPIFPGLWKTGKALTAAAAKELEGPYWQGLSVAFNTLCASEKPAGSR